VNFGPHFTKFLDMDPGEASIPNNATATSDSLHLSDFGLLPVRIPNFKANFAFGKFSEISGFKNKFN
jgi:hypothetical protein